MMAYMSRWKVVGASHSPKGIRWYFHGYPKLGSQIWFLSWRHLLGRSEPTCCLSLASSTENVETLGLAREQSSLLWSFTFNGPSISQKHWWPAGRAFGLYFTSGLVMVTFFWPKLSHAPKVVSTTFRSQAMVLQSFPPLPFALQKDERLHRCCPVRDLKIYIDCVSQWHKYYQLFLCFGGEARGLTLPLGVKDHSTRTLASSEQGVSRGGTCLDAPAERKPKFNTLKQLAS